MKEEAPSGRTISIRRVGLHMACITLIAIVVSALLRKFAPDGSIFAVELTRRLDVADLFGLVLGFLARELLQTFYPMTVRQ